MKNRLKEKLWQMPVTINNFYGDPTLQWSNTMSKLKQLEKDQHKGIVSFITRGLVTEKMAKELKALKLDKFVVLVSISNLPESIEPVSQKYRYETIKNLTKEGIKVLACVRPLIPSLNGDRDSIETMFKGIKEAGGKHVVVSGFRGDDQLVKNMNLDDRLEWSLRIKIMTKEMSKDSEELAQKYNLLLQKRVSCGVAEIFKEPSYNPYYNAATLLNCKECNLYKDGICGDFINDSFQEEEILKDIAVLEKLGYDLELRLPQKRNLCSVAPQNRTKCPSCCTACYIIKAPSIYIKNENISLADTAFLRFFTGMLSTQKGIEDLGGDTGIVKVMNYLPTEVYLVNSWYVLSKEQKNCFGCSYCITQAYEIEEREYGIFPSELYKMLEQRL